MFCFLSSSLQVLLFKRRFKTFHLQAGCDANMLTTWLVLCMPRPFKKDKSPPTIKLYKCTIMLQWCLPAAGPGGVVKRRVVVGEGVWINAAKYWQNTWRKTRCRLTGILHLGEVFIFTASAVKKESRVVTVPKEQYLSACRGSGTRPGH